MLKTYYFRFLRQVLWSTFIQGTELELPATNDNYFMVSVLILSKDRYTDSFTQLSTKVSMKNMQKAKKMK